MLCLTTLCTSDHFVSSATLTGASCLCYSVSINWSDVLPSDCVTCDSYCNLTLHFYPLHYDSLEDLLAWLIIMIVSAILNLFPFEKRCRYCSHALGQTALFQFFTRCIIAADGGVLSCLDWFNWCIIKCW